MRLRAHQPVAWTDETDGRGFWSITKYDDVLYASRHAEIFSSRQGIRMEDMSEEETEARRTLMEMDSPEHTRLRRLVARPFTPRAVADYEDAIRDLSREVLANLDGARKLAAAFSAKAKAAGLASVVFDRSGARYHGKVKAFADAAREGGLVF